MNVYGNSLLKFEIYMYVPNLFFRNTAAHISHDNIFNQKLSAYTFTFKEFRQPIYVLSLTVTSVLKKNKPNARSFSHKNNHKQYFCGSSIYFFSAGIILTILKNITKHNYLIGNKAAHIKYGNIAKNKLSIEVLLEIIKSYLVESGITLCLKSLQQNQDFWLNINNRYLKKKHNSLSVFKAAQYKIMSYYNAHKYTFEKEIEKIIETTKRCQNRNSKHYSR